MDCHKSVMAPADPEVPHVDIPPPAGTSQVNIPITRIQQKMLLTLYLDERFCNLSFGCLNSFVFICPASQKPDPLITA